jgi:hypothetical protein
MNARRRYKQKDRARISRLLRIEQDIYGVSGAGERFRQWRMVRAKLDGRTPPRY